MAYIENNPYAVEITKHILLSIDIRIAENIHRITIGSYDSNNILVKTDIIDLPVFDINQQVLMPNSWPIEWPSGAQLYAYLENAFYKRLHEEHNWLIRDGQIE